MTDCNLLGPFPRKIVFALMYICKTTHEGVAFSKKTFLSNKTYVVISNRLPSIYTAQKKGDPT